MVRDEGWDGKMDAFIRQGLAILYLIVRLRSASAKKVSALACDSLHRLANAYKDDQLDFCSR